VSDAPKKKPTDDEDLDDVIKVTKDSYPLEQSQYKDIRNIPVEDIFKSLVDNRSNIFYPWTSISTVSDLHLLYILLDNKIKCNILQYEGGENEININDQCESKEEKESEICDNNIWLKKNAEKIAKKYTKCSKNKEPLYIPMSVKTKLGWHANSLLLNPYRNEVEHFEPHGAKFGGSGIAGNVKWKQGVKDINKYLDKKLQLKYIPPKEVCPSQKYFNRFKGYQSADNDGEDKPQTFEGVVVTEIGGYCKMWNLFQLDLRLKTLKRSSGEVFNDMIKLFDEEGGKGEGQMIELMRGMSKYTWQQLINSLKPKFNKNNVTRDELIAYLDDRKGLDKDVSSRVWGNIYDMTQEILKNKFGKVF